MDTNTSSTTGSNGSNTSQGAGQAASAGGMRSQLTSLKAELDALVDRAPGMSDEELALEHARLMSQYSTLRYAAKGIATQATRQLNVGYETATRQFNRGVETTTGYVKEKPMQSVAVAAGAGMLLAMLFKRR